MKPDVLLLILHLCLSTIECKSKNLKLTDNNFKSNIEKGATFVKFFAPWCPHCTSMGADWEKLANEVAEDPEISKMVKVGEVDCTLNLDVCSDQGIQGFPTIVLFENGKLPEKYFFNRDTATMKSFLLGKFGPEVTPNILGIYKLDSKTWDRFHMSRSSYVVVYFKTKKNPACTEFEPIFDELVITFETEEGEDLAFAEVDCGVDQKICKSEDVEDTPMVAMYKNGDQEDIFTGDFSALEPLINFIWETVDPSRVEDDDDDDFDMVQVIDNLKNAFEDESDEDDDEDESDEEADSDDYDDDYIDIMEDVESDTVRVLRELIEDETKEDVKAVLQAKLDEIEQQSPEEILGPAYEILKEQVKKDDAAKKEATKNDEQANDDLAEVKSKKDEL